VNATPPVVRLADLSHRYGAALAADGVSLDLPVGRMVGFIGPEGVAPRLPDLPLPMPEGCRYG
jgi:ABC-type transporter Mla maintaining outer membrane lipid asymmetry ATPase subunit MlaF